MEGRAIARPNPRDDATVTPGFWLQWRAGQLPGQTRAARPPRPRRHASMEGRAIARPNVHGGVTVIEHVALQWRAGQLPGQTRPPFQRMMSGHHASMEGRAIARPNGRVCTSASPPKAASMEGRAIARPNRRAQSPTCSGGCRFNGGPGNCPAKRRVTERHDGLPSGASMEGRAIARPNKILLLASPWMSMSLQWRAGQLPGQTCQARLSTTPNHPLQWRAGQLPGQTPRSRPHLLGPAGASMEGRAIARPNAMVPSVSVASMALLQWRAGQLPGQTFHTILVGPYGSGLQWRAGQLPGQTQPGQLVLGDGEVASMEGRAIARPNTPAMTSTGSTPACFNGGPGNCPAKRPHRPADRGPHRASMEGRAIARPNFSVTIMRHGAWTASMEGRAIARPNNGNTADAEDEMGASMEGRAIARPNLPVPAPDTNSPWLQWRAGQLPGQTVQPEPVVRRGPDASMEGRAIARPNSPWPTGEHSE